MLQWLIGFNRDCTAIKNLDVATYIVVTHLILCLLCNIWLFSL
jgi:hypothetical protein